MVTMISGVWANKSLSLRDNMDARDEHKAGNLTLHRGGQYATAAVRHEREVRERFT